MTAATAAPAYIPLPAEGRYRRALASLRAMVGRGLRFRPRCLILGHEDAFAREPRRLMLRCAACGRETVGWAIGPGAPAVIAARRTSAGRRTAAPDTAIREGPWTSRRWKTRAEARDRQRQRLVAAASRAAEHRSEDTDSRQPGAHRAAARLLDERQPDRWINPAASARGSAASHEADAATRGATSGLASFPTPCACPGRVE